MKYQNWDIIMTVSSQQLVRMYRRRVMHNQKLSNQPFKTIIRKLNNIWNYCKVENTLESMRYIAHEDSPRSLSEGHFTESAVLLRLHGRMACRCIGHVDVVSCAITTTSWITGASTQSTMRSCDYTQLKDTKRPNLIL